MRDANTYTDRNPHDGANAYTRAYTNTDTSSDSDAFAHALAYAVSNAITDAHRDLHAGRYSDADGHALACPYCDTIAHADDDPTATTEY